MTKITIREVAAEAGVSVATVSRALRGLPSVAPATRSRVEEVAERLQYVPDPYAARLSSTRAHTLIVAIPLPGQWYYAQVVAGVEAVASEAGYDLVLHVVGDDVQRRHFIDDVLPGQRRVDGAVLVDIPIAVSEAVALTVRGLRLVAVGQRANGVVSVGIDNRTAAMEATDHLLGLGHRRIALLGGMPTGRSDLSIPGVRELGYRAALEGAGVEVDEALVMNGNFSIEGGFDAARDLLAAEAPPTAILALSDEMAAGALWAAREAGVSVPEDLSIVGFDDHDFAAPLGLTTIRQPISDLGEVAARTLLGAVQGVEPGGDQVLAHHLVLRETTGPCRQERHRRLRRAR